MLHSYVEDVEDVEGEEREADAEGDAPTFSPIYSSFFHQSISYYEQPVSRGSEMLFYCYC